MSGKNILIMGYMAKPGVPEQIEALRGWFDERVNVLAVHPSSEPLPDSVHEADLCVVFGGDGTLLAAARALAGTGVPLLGVNMGKFGFLAEYTVAHMQKHFDEILSGKIAPTERMMLDVCIDNCETHKFCSPAANDVAISAGAPFRLIDLNVSQGQRQIAEYLGDGLVVATPSGSTGYSMSAGGPILEPTLDAVTITPVAPHSLSMRPIVAGGEQTIRITATRVNPGTTVTIDGQISSGLCDGDTVNVRRADRGAMIVPHPGRAFFKTLSEKLQWGRSPHHSS